MYNFKYDIIDFLNEIPIWIWMLGIYFLIIFAIAAIVIYIISSLGLMKFAQKNKISNAWLAFVPCARYYIIGKLGFEIYSEKSNPVLTWVLFGLSCGTLLLYRHYNQLLRIGVVVLNAIAFYRIFKAIKPKNTFVLTLGTVLIKNLGGVFLYAMKNTLDDNEIKEAVVVEEKEKSSEKSDVKAKKNEMESGTKEYPNFCSNCGSKLVKKAKFCSNCGKAIK